MMTAVFNNGRRSGAKRYKIHWSEHNYGSWRCWTLFGNLLSNATVEGLCAELAKQPGFLRFENMPDDS